MKWIMLFLFPAIACATVQADIESITAARRTNHAYAYGQLRDLNYVRMKVNATTKAWNQITADWEEVKRTCRSGIPNLDHDNCTTQVNLLLNAANVQATDLRLMKLTGKYSEFARREVFKEMRFDEWIDRNERTFAKFTASMVEARDALGRRAAEVNLAKILSRMKEQDEKARLKVQCALLPPLQIRKLDSARLLRREAELESDPHLILKADLVAREVLDSARLLGAKCLEPTDLVSKVENFLKESPSHLEKIPALAAKACSALDREEFRKPCEAGNLTPAFLYSLHVSRQAARR